jgi:hypothetical protein
VVAQGRVVQLHSIKTRVESAYGVCNQSVKLQYDEMLSNFAFNLNLRRYSKSAEGGYPVGCLKLAAKMYADMPYAREVGHVVETAGVAIPAGAMEGHDIPPDVLTGVVHWVQVAGENPSSVLVEFRREALEGAKYCHNEGCEVVGHVKDFKVCPQCKTARYCGNACQKQDWTTGEHKEKCGAFHGLTRSSALSFLER